MRQSFYASILLCITISAHAYSGSETTFGERPGLSAERSYSEVRISADTTKTLTGVIQEESGTPVPFAFVAIYSKKDSTLVAGEMSDERGKFSIQFSGEADFVRISCIGYKTVEMPVTALDLGTIYMETDVSLLEGTTVVGRRKYISREDGGLTLNVQSSSLKNIGKAADVIKYIPGMLYANGKYEVFGKGEPVIYIDGRKMANASELSLLSSANVKSVRLITNPGAEYDAGTRSVIAITTVRHTLDGVSGIVGVELSRHKQWSGNEDVNLNIHKGAADVFLAYRYDNTKSDIRYDLEQTNYEEDTFHEISASEYSDRSRSHDYSVGMNYALNKNHSVGGKYMGTISDYKLLDSPYDYMQVYRNGELLTSTDNITDESEKERFHNANVYYVGELSDKLRLNVDADYVYSRLNHWQQVTETS